MRSNLSQYPFCFLIALTQVYFAPCAPVLATTDSMRDIKTVLDSTKNLRLSDYGQSLEVFAQRIRNNPRDVGARFGRGLLLPRQNHYQEALTDTNCAMSLAPDSSDVFNLHGFILLGLRNYTGALNDFNRAIDLDPMFIETYRARGVTLRHLGNYKAAIEDFNKAIKLNPSDSIAYTGRANTYRAMKSFDLAINDYDQASKLGPTEEIKQSRAATIAEQRQASTTQQVERHSAENASGAEDYGSPAVNQYIAHLKNLPLLAFAKEYETVAPNSQEVGYLSVVLAKRLPTESPETIVSTLAQLNPVGASEDSIYWQLVAEAQSRNFDPFAKISPARLASFVHCFSWQSNNHLIFFTAVIKRLPNLPVSALKETLDAVPLPESALRDEILREIQSRQKK